MKEFAERAAELGIQIYAPDFNADATLANWYKYLIDQEEFVKIFTEAQRPLSKFFDYFKPPNILAYTIDDAGDIWAAMWFTPFDGSAGTSAAVSAWTREDYRGGKQARETGGFCYSMAFKVWQVLVSTTRHEGLLRNLRQIGYNIVGSIPSLIEGDEAWILYLTKENFEKSMRYSGES